MRRGRIGGRKQVRPENCQSHWSSYCNELAGHESSFLFSVWGPFWHTLHMGRGGGGRLRIVVAFAVMAVVGGCAAPEIPDRTDPEVQAEEARLAEIIGADPSVLFGVPGTCSVRLLRQVEETAFVWAHCESGPPDNTGVSTPMRVVGSEVTVPGDGPKYEQDIRAMFPDDLIEIMLDGDDSLLPDSLRP